MKMAEHKKEWPIPRLQIKRGDLTISNVLEVAPGPERDAMVRTWCATVWNACGNVRETILGLARANAFPGAIE